MFDALILQFKFLYLIVIHLLDKIFAYLSVARLEKLFLHHLFFRSVLSFAKYIFIV